MSKLSSRVKSLLGLKPTKSKRPSQEQHDFTQHERDTFRLVKPFTMTSPERIVSLVRAVEHIAKHNISGDIVECGVWKGGSVMAMLHTLTRMNVTDRKIWLFDTFEGMSSPTDLDKDPQGRLAAERLQTEDKFKSNVWAYSGLEEVKLNVGKLHYPEDNINYVVGKVEDTLPSNTVGDIALLRLDTDWYESTKIEFEILYPKVQSGGIVIVDDYGHWEGCRRAVDEYFERNSIRVFLSRIDYTARIFVKP